MQVIRRLKEVNEHGLVFVAVSEGVGLFCDHCGPDWFDGVRWLPQGWRMHVDEVHRAPFFRKYGKKRAE